jgi:hypothetical protein
MLADLVKTRIETEITTLAGRVQHALELSALVAEGALPNAPQSAYIVPAGLRPVEGGESVAGAFTQEVDEVMAIVLVFNSAADVTGGKAAPRVDELVRLVLEAIAGWSPGTDYLGDFRFLRGQVVSLTKGAVIYQIEFAVPFQLRILA